MKLIVKTLKGTQFEIQVQPTDTVLGVKKNIEDVQGNDNYPSGQQLLIHNGRVLKDETTLAENEVAEDGFIVVMLSKATTNLPTTTTPISNSTSAPEASPQPLVSRSAPTTDVPTADVQNDNYGQAASNLVSGNDIEQTIQEIMDMGGGNWDRETVIRALRAAYNNPERAVDYLYSGIPETTEAAVPVARPPSNQVTETDEATGPPAPVSGAPNSSPLNMFPQESLAVDGGGGGGGGSLRSLDFLRSNQQFQALRSMVQANPQILQAMLQELGKQNPHLLGLIQDHQAEFLQLLNEPLEGFDGDLFDQPEQDMPQQINVTPAEQEAIERLEALGFDRDQVIEAFLACDRNEQLAANYLLEHASEFED